jgi:predicted 2-oxoglutarate/Fe(II)-dependent dioxygenase YbiX
MIWLTELLDDTQVNLYLNEFKEEYFMRCNPIGMGLHVKNNHVTTDEYRTSDHYKNIAKHVWNTLDPLRQEYYLKCATQPYPTWYKEGDYYDWHRDNYPIGGVNADYSMTLFLNDDYEGGELLIKVGDVVTEHKPKAGTVILYDTGLWHCVKPVTKGSRKVIVGWHESIIQNSFIRREMVTMGRELERDTPDWNVIKQVQVNLIREYGRPL